MIKKEDVKIGQEVWFYEKWSGSYCKGKVIEFYYDSNDSLSKEELKLVGVKINGVGDFIGSTCRAFENIYLTKKDLVKAIEDKNKSIVNKYISQIQTVEDLVKFMYDSPLNAEEYTDYNARKASKIMAKELLNIDLE